MPESTQFVNPKPVSGSLKRQCSTVIQLAYLGVHKQPELKFEVPQSIVIKNWQI